MGKKYLLVIYFLLVGVVFAQEKVVIISGDNQVGFAGQTLEKELVVQVLSAAGKPRKGVPVIFSVVKEPLQPPLARKKSPVVLSSPVVLTDNQGFASVQVNPGYPAVGQILISCATRATIGNPVIFHLETKKRFWVGFLLLDVIGGLGIFLFGMLYLNEGLQKIAGQKMRQVLITLTGVKWRAFLSGLVVTGLNQSSSATAVLVVTLVSAGLLPFAATMPLMMGAAIGSTVTAQLVAFRLSDYAVLISGIGFFLKFLSKTRRKQYIGEAILGFGVLFLGMKIMSDSLSPLKHYEPFMNLMRGVENPLAGILVGLFFTMIIQSSGATSGIVIALALSEAINLRQAISINLGASIGTCITGAIAAIGRGREGKRVVLWHTFFQTVGVILVYPFITVVQYCQEPAWIYFIKWFTKTVVASTSLARQIAMAHTLVSVFNAMIFWPLLGVFRPLMEKILPAKEEEKPFGPIYLQENLITGGMPELALLQAKKEILREGELVLEMYSGLWTALEMRSIRLLENISLKDIRVDTLRNAIIPYLTRIGQQPLSPEQAELETKLLYITADLEAVGDIIDRNMVPLLTKLIENKLYFSESSFSDLLRLHQQVGENLTKSLQAIRENDEVLAKYLAEVKPEIGRLEAELRLKYVKCLHAEKEGELSTSGIYLDILDHYKRIQSHLSTIGYVLLGKF